jgi:SAM-dependent methyltransferase
MIQQSTKEMTVVDVHPSNAEAYRAWDGEEGAYWAANADRFDRAVSGYHRRFMAAAEIAPGERVLDVGCGTGQTTREAARAAPSGWALGVDLSSAMLAVAREEAASEGLTNVVFEQVDAQIHPFATEPFDAAISRTGAMFFGDPVAAFTNIRRALRPGGRLLLLAWQAVAANEWIREFSTALAAGRSLPVPPADAPGPFSFADPDRVRRTLTAAGFTDIRVDDLAAPMWFGDDADDAYGFMLGLLAWMLDGLDELGREAALDALHTTMDRHATDRGVLFDSAAWLIQARVHRV